MATLSSELKFILSSWKNPNEIALGGALSGYLSSVSEVFLPLTEAELAAGKTDYKCIYVHNSNERETSPAGDLLNARVWISPQPSSPGIRIHMAPDDADWGTEAARIDDSTQAPAVTATFQEFSTDSNALMLGTIEAGKGKAIWLKRIVDPNTTSFSTNSFEIKFGGDTP
jgi:hypothetical protein